MAHTVEVKTTILPGSRIEVQAPSLPEGKPATVLITVEDHEDAGKRRLSEVLADYRGGRLFRSPEEVDAYLRAERQSWDN